MLNGVMLLWFLLTLPSVIFVAIDIRSTPESSVLKWGFVLLTLYTGPVGAFLYVLGCREPLPDGHEQYVSTKWRQVLGSSMHCVAGDGVGILAGAVIGSILTLSRPGDIALEYVLGFGFGWTIFQALFMRNMAGGSYVKSLASTFIPEFLSMNILMAAMVPVSTLGRVLLKHQLSPLKPEFWFVMSMALLSGFIMAYPMNWWLVTKGLKHGMMTVRSKDHNIQIHNPSEHHDHGTDLGTQRHMENQQPKPSPEYVAVMTSLSVTVLVLAIWLSLILGSA